MNQVSDTIFLIRPANFGYNSETAKSNAFQNNINIPQEQVSYKALAEFDAVIETLNKQHINIHVFNDTKQPVKPDAIFPNNWGSYHEDGTIILYPVAAKNRRLERRPDIIDFLKEHYQVKQTIDLSYFEDDGKYLESTGSIIFDHINKIAYACISERTNKSVLINVCKLLDYKPVYFTSADNNGKAIYHTNVMMCITEKLAIICLESIRNEEERQAVTNSLSSTEHAIINITLEQVQSLAGNMLGLKNRNKEDILVMSQTAYSSLSAEQIKEIETFTKLLPLDVSTIETIGGGSIRCMIAEIFLDPKIPSN